MGLNHELGESVHLANGLGEGVSTTVDAANTNAHLSRALLKVYSTVTGFEVVKIPPEIIDRWAAEQACGSYSLGVPGSDVRAALALIVAGGRFLVNAKDELDRAVVVELLRAALDEIPIEQRTSF
jgi:hypothetical protein